MLVTRFSIIIFCQVVGFSHSGSHIRIKKSDKPEKVT